MYGLPQPVEASIKLMEAYQSERDPNTLQQAVRELESYTQTREAEEPIISQLGVQQATELYQRIAGNINRTSGTEQAFWQNLYIGIRYTEYVPYALKQLHKLQP